MGDAGKKAPATPRPAATVVILRDGRAGIEVFMVVRHHEIDFASGALVFPGGKVDEADADPAWAELAPSSASAPERAFLVASARETFEEAGLMLARRGGGADMVGADEAHRLVETYRARLVSGDTTFLDLVRSENLRLAADLMVPFAHWITPESQPKRFDTRFLLVSAPVEQLGAHDGAESVEGFWIAPQQALRDAEAGTRTLLFPTHMNLLKLTRYASVAEAVAVTRATPIVAVMPRAERTATGRILRIPAEAGYGVTEFFVPMPAAKR
jgi:8-oxo-dGTP pyrophosphatase MutT (NUDIX family)